MCDPEMETRIVDVCRRHRRVPYEDVARDLNCTPELVKKIYAKIKKREERESAKGIRDKPSSS